MPRPNTTTVDQSGLGATATGTATAVALASTSYFTQSPRVQFVSAAGAGSSAGLNGSSLTAWRGNASGLGGFYFNCRAGISTFQTNGRAFIGLYSSASVIGNVNPSTLLNLIGLSIDSGQTTWRFITNDGAGTPTLKLALSGRAQNITLKLEDISKKMVRNVPGLLIDLIEIATYVYCADQAISRGGPAQVGMGADWRRSFRFVISAGDDRIDRRSASPRDHGQAC